MIYLKKINKVFSTARGQVHALSDVNLEVKDGEFLVLKGPSGSGKTTLLLTIGTMLQPTSGTVLIDDKDIYSVNEKERTRFRALYLGFVFQEFYLLPYLNILRTDLLTLPALNAVPGLFLRGQKNSILEPGICHIIKHKNVVKVAEVPRDIHS